MVYRFHASAGTRKTLRTGAIIGVRYRNSDESMYDPNNNRLVFLSDGLLVRLLLSESLEHVSCIVIDEAHEMSSNMCLLFTMLRYILTIYPHLKIVFASATIDPQVWVDYYHPFETYVVAPEGTTCQHHMTIHWPDERPGDFQPFSFYEEQFGVASRVPDLKTIESPADLGNCPQSSAAVIKAVREGVIGTSGIRNGDMVIFCPTQLSIYETKKAVEALGYPDLKV